MRPKNGPGKHSKTLEFFPFLVLLRKKAITVSEPPPLPLQPSLKPYALRFRDKDRCKKDSALIRSLVYFLQDHGTVGSLKGVSQDG